MVTFVHVFEKCNQDSGTVVAILDDVFKQLASIAPEISTIYLKQDNAGWLITQRQLYWRSNR